MSSAEEIALEANLASKKLKSIKNEDRVEILKKIHDGLLAEKDNILKCNKIDLEEAKKNNLSWSLIKRLDLSIGNKFESMLEGILDVAVLEDPLGKITLHTKLDEGLDLYRVSCPIGVILVIFESRPEVIANITSLAIKSGNAAILKGGKESLNTFIIISNIIKKILKESKKIPLNSVQLVSSRDEISNLLKQDKYIDLVIPRGSNQLVRTIKENTKIPVLGHADGICSIYVDKYADLKMAVKIILDSKTNYPAGCNSVETCLINNEIASKAVPIIVTALSDAGVLIKVTNSILNYLSNDFKLLLTNENKIVQATEEDFNTEFLNLTIAMDITNTIDDAIDHINKHSSKHTDVIITENNENANKFMVGVDSAGVFWNASSRFADGFRFGFGTEVGISTNKIHARGPVGLEGLVIYQYQIKGHGQIAGDYLGAGGSKHFLHQSD